VLGPRADRRHEVRRGRERLIREGSQRASERLVIELVERAIVADQRSAITWRSSSERPRSALRRPARRSDATS